jgi:hypothetical protein
MALLLLVLSIGFMAGGFVAFLRCRSALRWTLVSGAAVVSLFLGLLAVLAFGVSYSRPESGVALSSVEWLDSRASDISFYRANDFSGNFTYEFQISSEDFAALAKERGWQVAPLAEHRSIMRYTFFLPETDARRQRPLSMELDSGMIYESRRPNGGGITVLYDTNRSRAYVSQSSR